MQKLLPFLLILLMAATGYIFIYKNLLLPNRTKSKNPTIVNTNKQPTPINDNESNSSGILVWRDDQLGYEVQYPSSYKAIKVAGGGLAFDKSMERISLDCSERVKGVISKLPNPKEWEPNEGGYVVKNYKEITINGIQGVQFFWGPGPVGGFPHTSLLRKDESQVCELMIQNIIETNNFDDFIKDNPNYELILNSFRFL